MMREIARLQKVLDESKAPGPSPAATSIRDSGRTVTVARTTKKGFQQLHTAGDDAEGLSGEGMASVRRPTVAAGAGVGVSSVPPVGLSGASPIGLSGIPRVGLSGTPRVSLSGAMFPGQTSPGWASQPPPPSRPTGASSLPSVPQAQPRTVGAVPASIPGEPTGRVNIASLPEAVLPLRTLGFVGDGALCCVMYASLPLLSRRHSGAVPGDEASPPTSSDIPPTPATSHWWSSRPASPSWRGCCTPSWPRCSASTLGFGRGQPLPGRAAALPWASHARILFTAVRDGCAGNCSS
jgi:hypothetical protein